ncbi:MAG TPA: hypothetical protein VIY51_11520 [Xanthobacteraceae bacterium]
MLERIETLEQLRAEIEIGIRALDAGLGSELDIEMSSGKPAKSMPTMHRRVGMPIPSWSAGDNLGTKLK